MLRGERGQDVLSDDDAVMLRTAIGAYVSEAVTTGDANAAFVKNKLAQVTAQTLALEYPARWPSFFSDLVNLLNLGAPGVDMFTRVLEAIDEEVVATTEAGRTSRGELAHSMRIKEAMRADGSLQLVFDAWHQCLTHFAQSDSALAARVFTAARRYVDWVDVSIVASEAYVSCAKECLMLSDSTGCANEDLRAAAAAYLHAVFTKGMDTGVKVKMIINMNAVDICAALQTICSARPDDFEEEFVTQVTYLAASIGTELLNANKMENITALGADLSSQASGLLHTVTPVILASINSKHERAVLATLPFLTSYISYVKSQPALMLTAQPALMGAFQALIARGAFPSDDDVDDLDWNDGSNALAAELAEDVFNLRAELNVQFRNIARLAPQLARDVVWQVLRTAIPSEGDGGNVRWQNVEAAVSAVYSLGEGADDAAVKPMSSAELAKATNGTGAVTDTPLGQLAISLIRQWGPNVGGVMRHRIVAPVFLETCVRYHVVLERDDVGLGIALGAFLDERGVRHIDPSVRSRACYLLSRFTRPLRCKLSDQTGPILSALSAPLTDAARDVGASQANVASVTIVGIQSRAMAEVGNDDRLYLFEAVGMILGADDVDEATQIEYLKQVARMLCEQIEQAVAGRTDDNSIQLATRAIVAIGNISKGFSERTCVATRPGTGEIFRSCLEMTLKCLDVWPRNSSVRNRVTAFLHRMIELLGSSVTPYLAPVVDKLRRDAGAVELRETLVLFNQLLATYKTMLAPFVVDILPSLTSQVFSTVAREYAQASATAKGEIALNTESVREASDLERTWLTTTSALGSNGLLTLVFAGDNLQASTELRESMINRLMDAATSHSMVSVRKVALQSLKSFVEAWTADSSPEAPLTDTTAPVRGPRQDIVPGFTQFVIERVCAECCIVPPLRGDLNLADAVSVTVLNESTAILSLAFARQREHIERVIARVVLPAILPRSSPEHVAAVAAEYARVCTLAKSQSSSKPMRALIDAVREEIANKGPVHGFAPKIARRGM
jgi:exportin-T